MGCVSKERETALLKKIEKLEALLDECQNGAKRLHSKMKIYFEKANYDSCKIIFAEMEKRHPDSNLFPEVKKLYQEAFRAQKLLEEEKQRQKEKDKRIKLQALNKLVKNYDDVSDVTWYHQPYFTHYNNKNLVSIYIGKMGNYLFLRLKMSYKGEDWIFFENAFLSYDGETKQIYFDKYTDKKTEIGNGGSVWEWIDVQLSEDSIQYLRKFCESRNAKMRLSGKYTETRNLTWEERQGIKDVLDGYDTLVSN
jgi:hypothetical protein